MEKNLDHNKLVCVKWEEFRCAMQFIWSKSYDANNFIFYKETDALPTIIQVDFQSSII